MTETYKVAQNARSEIDKTMRKPTYLGGKHYVQTRGRVVNGGSPSNTTILFVSLMNWNWERGLMI